MSNLLPSALVRSTTPTLNQLAGAQQTSPRPQPSSFLIHPSSFTPFLPSTFSLFLLFSALHAETQRSTLREILIHFEHGMKESAEKSKSLESWIWDAACSIRGA